MSSRDYKPAGSQKLRNEVIIVWPYEVSEKIGYIMSEWDIEWQWFHTVRREFDEGNRRIIYHLEGLYVPEQECQGKEVESSGENQASMMRMIMNAAKAELPEGASKRDIADHANKTLSRLSGWCHSHHKMPVDPSTTDEETFENHIQLAANGGSTHPQVMLILNNKGQTYTRIYDPELNLDIENASVHVDYPEVDMTECDEIIVERFKRKKVEAATVVNFQAAAHRPTTVGVAQQTGTQTTSTGKGGQTNAPKWLSPTCTNVRAHGDSTSEAGRTTGTHRSGKTRQDTLAKSLSGSNHQPSDDTRPKGGGSQALRAVIAERNVHGVTVVKKKIVPVCEPTQTVGSSSSNDVPDATPAYKPASGALRKSASPNSQQELPVVTESGQRFLRPGQHDTADQTEIEKLVAYLNRKSDPVSLDRLLALIEQRLPKGSWPALYCMMWESDETCINETSTIWSEHNRNSSDYSNGKELFEAQMLYSQIDPAHQLETAIEAICRMADGQTTAGEAKSIMKHFLDTRTAPDTLSREIQQRQVGQT